MTEPGAKRDPEVLMSADETQRLLASNPALAEARVRRYLDETPGNPGALWVLGAALRRQHRSAEARTVLEPLAQSHPHMPHVHYELGMALADLCSRDEAVVALARTVDLLPGFAEAWCALGDQMGAGSAPDANPPIDDPELSEAIDAVTDGRMEIVQNYFELLIKKHPADLQAMKRLAEALLRAGRRMEATALLARCVEAEPEDQISRFHLAALLFAQNKAAETLLHTDELLKRDPANFYYHALKAASLVQMGEYARAIKEYEMLLQDALDRPGAWMAYGRALRGIGRDEDCVAAFRKSIEILPGFIEAYWSLATVKTFRFASADVDVLRAQVTRTDLIARSRAELHFALAKALEDVGEYAEAFEHYRTSNLLQGANDNYRAEENSRRIRRWKDVFTPAFFCDRGGSGCQLRDPIFIVGMPRAGSTLIEQILASHSAVEGTTELAHIKALVARLESTQNAGRARRYPEELRTFDPQGFAALGEGYLALARSHRKTTKPLFTDKMPGNFAHIGLIHLILPNAKIIDARRHPLDCCVSCFKNYFPANQPFTHRLTDIGRFYADYVELMAHYDEALPGKVYRVIHERLVEDPEGEVRRLLDYLELPFEDECLRFYEKERAVFTLSSEQVRMPIHKKSLEHWRRFEPWLGPLKESLGYVLDVYPAAPKYYAGIRVKMTTG